MKDTTIGDTLFEFMERGQAAQTEAAKVARDAAIKQVAGNSGDWMQRAFTFLCRLPRGFTGIGEQIRLELMRGGLEPPHHHNAWGALILLGVKRGVLRGTGRIGHMKTEKSHARKSEIYERR